MSLRNIKPFIIIDKYPLFIDNSLQFKLFSKLNEAMNILNKSIYEFMYKVQQNFLVLFVAGIIQSHRIVQSRIKAVMSKPALMILT